MNIGDIVIHVPGNRNWMFKGADRNPRSKNRKVKILNIYNSGMCADITPINGYANGQVYVCNISDLKE